MPLHPANIEKLILKNCIAAMKDISKLTFRGYDFLYQASNFIAHYNVHGFKDHYGTGRALATDIVLHQKDNQWLNFSPGHADYEYHQQQKRIYNALVAEAVRQYPSLVMIRSPRYV